MAEPVTPTTVRADLGPRLKAVLVAVLSGAAGGGLWALISTYTSLRLDWLALPLAWLLARLSRRWLAASRWGAPLATLATLAALAYRSYLLAALIVSDSVGFSLLDTLRLAGNGLLFKVAQLGLGWSTLVCYALALIIASRAARRIQ